jgi:hypothetical protein
VLALSLRKKWHENIFSFFSFYKEKNQKKIVVLRIARCSRLYASAAAFNERIPTVVSD